jgi:hypothetical protein
MAIGQAAAPVFRCFMCLVKYRESTELLRKP